MMRPGRFPRRLFVRTGLLAPVAAAVSSLLPAPARAERIWLSGKDRDDIGRIEAGLNGIRSLQARFVQRDPGGRLDYGLLRLRRPGLLRMDYESMPLRLTSDGVLIIFHEYELGQVSRLPLRHTPLSPLLYPDLDLLQGPAQITGLKREAARLSLTLRRRFQENAGALVLSFLQEGDDWSLAGWTILDAVDRRTEISLFSIVLNPVIPGSVFTVDSDA